MINITEDEILKTLKKEIENGRFPLMLCAAEQKVLEDLLREYVERPFSSPCFNCKLNKKFYG